MHNNNSKPNRARIYYARVDENWRKEEKLKFLAEKQHIGNIEWQEIEPDEKHNWLTEGMHDEFEVFIPMGSKKDKGAKALEARSIFKSYSLGISTNRDNVVYDFDKENLLSRVEKFCEDYNREVRRYLQKGKPKNIDEFIDYKQLKWSLILKGKLKGGHLAEFNFGYVRSSAYRPFTSKSLYFDKILIDAPSLQRKFVPASLIEATNLIIGLTGVASEKPFLSLVSNLPIDLHFSSPGCGTQCFPFYIYNEDGTNRRENITDWALAQFRAHYKDKKISKWNIFHYVYALLHHPSYRTRYAANLKRELPRIPFAPDFHALAKAGAQLADLHVNYEQQPEYPLERIENAAADFTWRVEKMKLSKDKTQLIYNDFLTLDGIPAQAFDYRLGNRSALDWIIDQYQVSTDKRSGITNDPNRDDDPQYIVRLIGQVIHVSLETVKIVTALPDLGLPTE